MKMSFLVFAIIAAVTTMMAIPPVYSCSCVPTPPPEQAFQDADAVLMGKVISIQNGPGQYYITAKLRVSKIWKGERDFSTALITTSDDGAMCGFNFQTGKSYVIYAYKNQDGRFQTNNCTRSRSSEHATEDLAYLDTLPSAGKGSGGCGSRNVLGGDLYLFVGMMFYFFKSRSKK